MATGSVKNAHPNARVRKLDGKIVKPCLYNGIAIGHGKYFAAEVDGVLILDENKKPIQFRECGQLELINAPAK